MTHVFPLSVLPGSYMMVDTSQHDYGEKARLQLPVMKENDTHCIDFNYLLYCPDGSSPGTLNILVKVNKGPLANPIWNVTSCTGRDWMKAELAVSTFWPNEYQVCKSLSQSEDVACFEFVYLSRSWRCRRPRYTCGEVLCRLCVKRSLKYICSDRLLANILTSSTLLRDEYVNMC